MIDLKLFYWLSDVVGSFTGILLNILLLITIYVNKSKHTNLYSPMLAASAAYDALFSFIELMTQHVSTQY